MLTLLVPVAWDVKGEAAIVLTRLSRTAFSSHWRFSNTARALATRLCLVICQCIINPTARTPRAHLHPRRQQPPADVIRLSALASANDLA